MLKFKLTPSLILFLIICFTFSVPEAFAGDSFLAPYLSFHTVASSGLTEAKTTFDLTEKPWLYIERDTAFSLIDTDSIKWYSVGYPSGVSIEVDYDQVIWNDDYTAAWVAFEDGYWYDTLSNKEGTWTIVANIGGDLTSAETNFTVTTVTPEPISAVLFLTGGAALFLRRRRGTVMRYEA